MVLAAIHVLAAWFQTEAKKWPKWPKHVFIHIHTYTQTCTHTKTYTNTNTHMHIHMHIKIHRHKHVNILHWLGLYADPQVLPFAGVVSRPLRVLNCSALGVMQILEQRPVTYRSCTCTHLKIRMPKHISKYKYKKCMHIYIKTHM